MQFKCQIIQILLINNHFIFLFVDIFFITLQKSLRFLFVSLSDKTPFLMGFFTSDILKLFSRIVVMSLSPSSFGQMPLLHFKYYGTSCCVCPTITYNFILEPEVVQEADGCHSTE